MRTKLGAAFLTAALATTVTVVANAAVATANNNNDTIPYFGDCADPTVVESGAGDWFAYCTNVFPFGITVNTPVFRSVDAQNWFYVGDALPQLGSWARPGLTWAPGVGFVGGAWRLYYTARDIASDRQCVGVASSASPAGPFTDDLGRALVCEASEGGSIDADVYFHAGRAFLTWKVDANAIGRRSVIRAQELSADGISLIGRPRNLLSQSARWEAPLIEQPSMINFGGRWILTYSANWWESDRYATGYAVCRGPLGPCTKRTNRGPAIPNADAQSVGQGAIDFFPRNGEIWMVYHGWSRTAPVGYANGGFRMIYTKPADWILARMR